MVRVKRGTILHRKRERLLKQAKGFRWGRKSKYVLAKDALFHAWKYSFKDRKRKKREFRKLWQVQINAGCRTLGVSYSKFINQLKKARIELNRKILSELAGEYPEIFQKIIEKVKK